MFKIVKNSSTNFTTKKILNQSFNMNFNKHSFKFINNQPKTSFNKTSFRSFSEGNNFFNFVPKPVAYCIFGSFGIFLIGSNMTTGQYVKQFLYNRQSFTNGNIISLATNHLAKTSFFDLIVDTLIMGLFGMNLNMMAGEFVVRKLIATSVVFSSVILLTMHSDEIYIKSEAILRGLIVYIIAMDPYRSFLLFPLPIKITAYWILIFLVAVDILSKKYCNFGGTIAAVMMIQGAI